MFKIQYFRKVDSKISDALMISFMGYQIKTSGDTDPCPVLLSPLHVHATPIDLFPESYRIWVGANIKRNYDANLRKLNLAIKQFKSKILNKMTAGLIQI